MAHFTGSGINEVLNYDVDFFNTCLETAIEIYKDQQKIVKEVYVKGFLKTDENG